MIAAVCAAPALRDADRAEWVMREMVVTYGFSASAAAACVARRCGAIHHGGDECATLEMRRNPVPGARCEVAS